MIAYHFACVAPFASLFFIIGIAILSVSGKGGFNMRIVHLIEYEWIDPKDACPRNVMPVAGPNGAQMAYKMLGKSMQRMNNESVRQLYKYLRTNGYDPYMTEKNGSIRIQYFRWPRGYHFDKVNRQFVRDDA